jgi:hypothetical protein
VGAATNLLVANGRHSIRSMGIRVLSSQNPAGRPFLATAGSTLWPHFHRRRREVGFELFDAFRRGATVENDGEAVLGGVPCGVG